MRIWSISLIKSDWKWCMHLSRSLYLNWQSELQWPCNKPIIATSLGYRLEAGCDKCYIFYVFVWKWSQVKGFRSFGDPTINYRGRRSGPCRLWMFYSSGRGVDKTIRYNDLRRTAYTLVMLQVVIDQVLNQFSTDYRISGIFRVGLIFAEFATSMKSPKIDTAKMKPYYTSSLRALE